jgi:hypothetical protein
MLNSYAVGMRDAQKEIKDIRDTIQFAMVVIIFFSTLLYGALKSAGVADTNANAQSIIWGVGIAFDIANYFIVGVVAELITEYWMKWIKVSIVIGILSFIDPIIVGAAYANKTLSWFPAHLFLACMYVAFAMPIATFILFMICAYWYMLRDLWRFVRNKFKHTRTG